MGPLVLSVQVAADHAAASTDFDTGRARLGPTEILAGLGQAAYRTTTATPG